MPTPHRKYVLYADGACIGNPGPGGWGVVVAEPGDEYRELSGGPYPHSTNNKMEITAVIEGLRDIQPGSDVIVRSDSSYVVNTMMLGWKRKANEDLWRELDREVDVREVRFEWVRGHSGDKHNERADKLAASAARGLKLELGAGVAGATWRKRPREAGAAAQTRRIDSPLCAMRSVICQC